MGAALLVVALGASSYPGCAVYSQSLIGSSRAGDTGTPGDENPAPACMPAVPPSRPDPDAAGSTSIGPIVAAFRTIDIGVSGPLDAGIPPFGYDLDHTCTCPGPPSCLQRSDAGGTQDCDDPQGRDNLDIQLFRLLRGPATTGTSQIDQGLAAGQFGLLLVIRDYNGSGFDPQVTVEFYLSNGLDRDADGGIPLPKFDGTDSWTIDPGSLVQGQPGAGPEFVDDKAYVYQNTVVANPPMAIPIAFGDGTFLGGATMLLTAPTIVGSLQASSIGDGGAGTGFGYALTGGTIAGRWPTTQILSTLSKIPVEGGTFICPTESQQSEFNYNVIKSVVCNAADISSTPQGDNNVPLAPCDAISVGMQFTAVPAQLGSVLEVTPPPSGCKSDGGVLFMDTCTQ
jgi:hypothetical protein